MLSSDALAIGSFTSHGVLCSPACRLFCLSSYRLFCHLSDQLSCHSSRVLSCWLLCRLSCQSSYHLSYHLPSHLSCRLFCRLSCRLSCLFSCHHSYTCQLTSFPSIEELCLSTATSTLANSSLSRRVLYEPSSLPILSNGSHQVETSFTAVVLFQCTSMPGLPSAFLPRPVLPSQYGYEYILIFSPVFAFLASADRYIWSVILELGRSSHTTYSTTIMYTFHLSRGVPSQKHTKAFVRVAIHVRQFWGHDGMRRERCHLFAWSNGLYHVELPARAFVLFR